MKALWIWLGWLVALSLFGYQIWPSPEQEVTPVSASADSLAETPAVPAQVSSAAETPPASLEVAENRRLRLAKTRCMLQTAEWQQRVAELAAELATQKAEVERYRIGLERAVAELNRQTAARGVASKPRRKSSARSSRSERRGSTMRSARQQASLQVVGNQIFVSGEMRNPRRQATDGVLWVELRRDGQTIDRARYLVEIEAGEKAPFEHRFQLMDLGEGTLSARAVLEY